MTKSKNARAIVTSHLVRVRRRDFSLKYSDDVGFALFPPERIEEDVWDQEQFQDSVVKRLEEYTSLASALGPKSALLENFARAVSVTSFHGLADTELSERVSALGRELEDQPLPVTVTAFINGLSISESPLVISDRLVLRQPTAEDVAEHIVVDEYGGFSFPLNEVWFRVVGVFISDSVSTGAAQQEFLRTLEALRLFRVGGISTNRYRMRSRHSLLGGEGGVIGGPGRHSRFTYTLSNSDAPALARFLHDIVPRLPNPFSLDTGTTEAEIAYTRYRDSLFQDRPSERTVTSAITALEALFLRGEPELTHRLAQRVSVFLRVLGTQLDAGATYDHVKRGYGIRSTFIHGGSLKAKDRPQADSLAPVLVEYVRECALAFFQVTATKEELLNHLDRAMIDPASLDNLVSSLAPVVHR